MDKYKQLIDNIEQSNLSDEDKDLLINKLKSKDLDLNDFLKSIFSILNLSKELLKLFDLDIGD
ncbi:hypothetical protein M9Q43_02870 [Flavobacterium sp. HXWNR29]|uniref:hypothetical protein n=1 Tax=Flavobacterium odoriferum TaxID=2946604 RepID=UPI0021CB3CDE|nr:hypothetical protein [Flavobacterium sp. HXWNR29]MCU4188107.1 hypothetical protein [Flavobacterium sp. HXWNR29]